MSSRFFLQGIFLTRSPVLQADSLPSGLPEKPLCIRIHYQLGSFPVLCFSEVWKILQKGKPQMKLPKFRSSLTEVSSHSLSIRAMCSLLVEGRPGNSDPLVGSQRHGDVPNGIPQIDHLLKPVLLLAIRINTDLEKHIYLKYHKPADPAPCTGPWSNTATPRGAVITPQSCLF